MYGVSFCSPNSNTVTMLTCWRRAAALASWKKRACALGVAEEARRHHLDRDLAAEDGIAGAIQHTERALPDALQQLVASESRRIGHVPLLRGPSASR